LPLLLFLSRALLTGGHRSPLLFFPLDLQEQEKYTAVKAKRERPSCCIVSSFPVDVSVCMSMMTYFWDKQYDEPPPFFHFYSSTFDSRLSCCSYPSATHLSHSVFISPPSFGSGE
jgi:hypothetical protein